MVLAYGFMALSIMTGLLGLAARRASAEIFFHPRQEPKIRASLHLSAVASRLTLVSPITGLIGGGLVWVLSGSWLFFAVMYALAAIIHLWDMYVVNPYAHQLYLDSMRRKGLIS